MKTSSYEEISNGKNGRAPASARTETSAAYLQSLAEATNDAVRDWDLATGAVTWRCGLENLSGFRPTSAAGEISFWFSRMHPEDMGRIKMGLREALAGTAKRWTGEYRLQRADGEFIHILERAAIARDSRQKAQRCLSSLMDVSAWKQSQTRVLRSQRMEAFGQLAGGLAHDFNNFLTTILGYSDLLLNEEIVAGEVAQQIAQIRDAAGRASALTNQLLAFSRRQALEPTVLEINSFISNLEQSLLRLLGENISIVCQLHPAKGSAHIQADAGQITQILLNLAVNARDAMRQGGCLTISTNVVESRAGGPPVCECIDVPPGEYVQIDVSDNGPGMSEEVKSHLFEPFFTTKEDDGRSGLGLASSYGIVRQSGGHICVESAPGRGTTFHIFFPRVPAPVPTYKKRTSKKSVRGSETILVLEDDVSVRHLSVRVLRDLGYHVIEAARGDDAKRLVNESRARKIDLLLTDLVLPEMSGRNFADWLRQKSPSTKVIFVSGYLDESLHPVDRRDPEMSFLPKPFTPNEVASKVREVLDC